MSQKTITVGTEGTPADIDINFGNSQSNFVELYADKVTQDAAIELNTAKTGISTAQANAIIANTAKVGITTEQAAAIVTNTAKVSFDSTSSARLADTSGTNTGDQVGFTKTLTATAGNSFSAGTLGYISAAGTVTLADSSAEISSKSMLVMATATISGGASGVFAVAGSVPVTSHGFTLGLPLFVDDSTTGAVTTIAPTTTNHFLRVIGYAVDTNTIFLTGDTTWIKIQ